MPLSARARGYGTRWEKARVGHLLDHPLCAMCLADGMVTSAKVVDHIVPHRGDQTLFWSKANWQSLCTTHHNATKQRIEARGIAIGCDTTGQPIDPTHPWHRQGA